VRGVRATVVVIIIDINRESISPRSRSQITSTKPQEIAVCSLATILDKAALQWQCVASRWYTGTSVRTFVGQDDLSASHKHTPGVSNNESFDSYLDASTNTLLKTSTTFLGSIA